jgi:hypothetical protein
MAQAEAAAVNQEAGVRVWIRFPEADSGCLRIKRHKLNVIQIHCHE